VIPVRFAPEVSDEIAEAASWHEARSRGLGNEFIAEIETTLPSSEAARSRFQDSTT
jgi:hypothetical protein